MTSVLKCTRLRFEKVPYYRKFQSGEEFDMTEGLPNSKYINYQKLCDRTKYLKKCIIEKSMICDSRAYNVT